MLTPSIKKLIFVQCIRTLSFAAPISTLFLLQKGLTLQQTFTLSSVILVSGMIFEVPTGVIADKFGRKTSMILGSFTSVIAWGLWLNMNSFIGFATAFVLLGLAEAFWSGADQAMIYDELKANGQQDQAQKVFSRYSSILAISFAVSSFTAGFIASTHTIENFYLLIQLTFYASIIALIFTFTISEPAKLKTKKHNQEIENPSLINQLSSGFRLLKNNSKLRKITLFSIFTLSFALMETYQVYFKSAEVPQSWYGFVLGISSLLIGVSKWNAYKLEKWFGVEKSMLIITIIPAILWTAMAFVLNPIIAVLIFLISDSIGCMRDPIIADYQNRHINGPERATALSTISLMTNGYIALMLPITGLIANKNLPASFLFCATIILVGLVFFRIRSTDVIALKD